MNTNKDTKLYFSIAEIPGNFGATFFNYAFQEMQIDAIYKPLKLERKFLNYKYFERFLDYCKEINIAGISVSMPFKRKAYFECIIDLARSDARVVKAAGNVNTLVFGDHFRPSGFNTDCIGFERANREILSTFLNEKVNTPYEKAIVYGSGAVSDSICAVLRTYGKEFARLNKDESGLLEHNDGTFDYLINASPVGMEGIEDNIFTEKIVEKYDFVFDVVGGKTDTNLVKLAKSLDKKVVKGSSMQFEGACEQFKIYSGLSANRLAMSLKMEDEGYL